MLEPRAEYLPAGQLWQLEAESAAVLEKVPAGQEEQPVAPEGELEYWPGRQALHPAAPAAEYEPPRHEVHDPEAAVA